MLHSKIFPKIWKKSYINPIHKKGDKSHITNYRPIICAASKILEKIIHGHILHLTKDSIAPQQHGFRSGKSTITNLAEYTDYLTKNIVNGGEVHSLYADISSAIDQINHNILLTKLKKLWNRKLYALSIKLIFN